MAWEVKVLHEFESDILEPIAKEAWELACERSEESEGNSPEDFLNDAISEVVDYRMAYYADQLAVVQAYGKTSEAFQLAWEDFFSDVYEHAVEYEGEE